MLGEQASAAPLAGIKVVDIGHLVAGPMVASMLGDFGAEVIKVERPGHGDPFRKVYPKGDIGLWSKVQDRNKTPITLDLKTERGQELLERLLVRADVLVENFRPGVLERLGFDPDRLLADVNPGLVICRVSGWGQTGPLSDRRGYGRTGEAGSGFAHLNGEPDGPPMHSAVSLGDTAAAIFAAFGIMLALKVRDRDGRGQVVDVALYESLMRMIDQQLIVLDQLGKVLGREGNENPGVPTVNVYETRDGRHFSVSNATPRTQERFIALVGLEGDPDLGTLERILDNRERFHEHVSRWMLERDLDDIDRAFHEAGAVGTPIWSAQDLIDHPHVVAREMVVEAEDRELGAIRMTGIVPKLSRTPGTLRSTGRLVGEGNEAIFGDLLGLPPEEIESLRRDGVI
jgi:crotonobetainyl-CoA:carnitine CoA-transferase CaiB-like acyl-CoA transferase